MLVDRLAKTYQISHVPVSRGKIAQVHFRLDQPAEILDRVGMPRPTELPRQSESLFGFAGSLFEFMSIVTQMAFGAMPISERQIL